MVSREDELRSHEAHRAFDSRYCAYVVLETFADPEICDLDPPRVLWWSELHQYVLDFISLRVMFVIG